MGGRALLGGLALVSAGCLANDKAVFGLHEKVRLPKLALELPAKLDTGAETASLSARNIQLFRRAGEPWVRFQLALAAPAQGATLERPLRRIGYIKRRAGDRDPGDARRYSARPVIGMEVCLGDRRRHIEVNLTDRTAFDYPLLIGATALKQFDALVDPGLRYSAGAPGCS
ncbi:hypothetical protein D3C78_678470 [compost metagenome]